MVAENIEKMRKEQQGQRISCENDTQAGKAPSRLMDKSLRDVVVKPSVLFFIWPKETWFTKAGRLIIQGLKVKLGNDCNFYGFNILLILVKRVFLLMFFLYWVYRRIF